MTSGLPVYEAGKEPGGICNSYYVRPGSSRLLRRPPEDGLAYRFEPGGGHWLFGGDPAVLHLIRSLAPVRSYQRRSAVYFPEERRLVPYPLQNHLGALGNDIAAKALQEIIDPSPRSVSTLADWLNWSFGPTLTDLFFGPFHEMYTAGLWTRVSPQDAYKSPIDLSLVVKGAFEPTPAVGYNTTFLYPVDGLDGLVGAMAGHCVINYAKTVARVDLGRKEVQFTDGSGLRYDRLVSTIPLNVMAELSGVSVDEEPGPYTSVLVLNIGAVRGPECPAEHWIYLPSSRSGFHRVGFYNNVDPSFVPAGDPARVGIYVERACAAGHRPDESAMKAYSEEAVRELREWGFIEDVEVTHLTWIEVAYTWSLPASDWRRKTAKTLEEQGVLMAGRYGMWRFQGIGESIRDGLIAGSALYPWSHGPRREV